VEVLRSGQPGMDAGLAAPGHGWPMAAGPREQDRSEGMPSHGEAPNERGKSAWLLGAGRRSVSPSNSP
jgi:hypothetical protein